MGLIRFFRKRERINRSLSFFFLSDIFGCTAALLCHDDSDKCGMQILCFREGSFRREGEGIKARETLWSFQGCVGAVLSDALRVCCRGRMTRQWSRTTPSEKLVTWQRRKKPAGQKWLYWKQTDKDKASLKASPQGRMAVRRKSWPGGKMSVCSRKYLQRNGTSSNQRDNRNPSEIIIAVSSEDAGSLRRAQGLR